MAQSGFLDTFEALGAALGGSGDAVLKLRLDQIDEDPDNPRRNFDDAELEALAQTIAARGVLQPVVVRPADAAGRYRLRFGARRFRAARRAGLEDIPAVVRGDAGDAQDDLIEQLIENDQREGLSTSELAEAVDKLLDGGLTQAEVGRRLGRSKPQIAMLAAVKGMAPELRALAPKLGARTLYELHAAWKADAGQARKFLKERRPETITQAEARELASRTGARQVRDPSDGSVRVEPELTAAAEPPAASRPVMREPSRPREGVGNAVFEVRSPGVRGTLVLDNVRAATTGVSVRRANGEVVTVPAESVKILRMRPG